MSDTSAKAVERLFKLVAMHGDDADAATLRALLAERGELLRDVRQLQEGHNAAWEQYSAIASERFTLRAERDRLREVQAAILAALKETGHE